MKTLKTLTSIWLTRRVGLRVNYRSMALAGIAALLSINGSAALAAPLSAAGPNVPYFFVAPNGNDQWSGRLSAPNAKETDGPFATLARARDALREFKRQQAGKPSPSAVVTVRAGHYFLTEPLVFTPEDSGAANGKTYYVAAAREQPVISGGRHITNWKPATVNGKQLWVADIPEVRAGKWYFHELWVNDQRRQRARHPNQGYLSVEAIPDAKSDTPWSEGQARFRFKAGDLKAGPTITNAEVCVMNRWVESHLPVAGVDETDRLVSFRKRSVFKLDPGDLYYVENALEFLDQPGEWYLDRHAGRLYYMPMAGEEPDRTEVIAPVLAQAVRFEGKPEAGQFVENLVFEGLTFAHTEWYFPSGFDTGKDKAEVWPPPKAEVGGFAQAAVGVPGAVRGEGVRQVDFEHCNFIHLGNYALELGRGCQSNSVRNCDLGDLGAGGIKLGETAIRDRADEMTFGNTISDCHIHDGGQMFHSAIGVWIGQSPSNRLLHNHIHDFYYSGISIGWTWGYGRALATNNAVEFNHVHHIGVKSNGDGPILSDMAGIYTLGLQEGTVIRNNLWHDSAGFRYGGWGIYFDEGTTHILAESNVVYRTTHGGFHQHYGKENMVRNNIFALAREHQIQRTRPEPHLSFTFERNIVYWDRGRLFGGNLSDTNYLFNQNLYWHVGGGEVRFDKWLFTEWQQRGQDTNSLIADPKFIDPAKDNFTLQPDSPAFKLGFHPINLKNVGIRPAAPK